MLTPRSRRAVLASLCLALPLPLVGCGLLPGSRTPDPSPTSAPGPSDGETPLPRGTTEVEVAVGKTAQVDLGAVSPGVGDAWGVTAVSDPAIAEAEVVLADRVFGVDPTQQPPGSSVPGAVALTGLAPGTTTVHVVYCYRSAVAEGCDQGPNPTAPIDIAVTVR